MHRVEFQCRLSVSESNWIVDIMLCFAMNRLYGYSISQFRRNLFLYLASFYLPILDVSITV